MGNRITRTILFAASALLSISAFGAGAARFGTLRNADWVVTNAWQAVSNKTHDLILEIGHEDSRTGIVDRALSYGTETYWTDATGIVWKIVGSTTNVVGRVALTNDIPDSVSADLTPSTNYTNQVAGEFENGTRIVREAEIAGNAASATSAESANYAIAADSLIGIGVTYNWSDFFRQATNAAIAVADAKISTNNAAFVSAVLAAPLVGADPSDLSEIAEYGSYGTVGAAILALIAGLAALKRRMTAAETAIDGKADVDALPYALVVPGSDWRFSGAGVQPGVTYTITQDSTERAIFSLYADGVYVETVDISDDPDMQASLYFSGAQITATRTLPDHLADRAVNAVTVTGATTLTLPAANPGHARDLYVRLTVSATSAVTLTVAQGESWDAMGAPPASFVAGTYLYRFTEVAAGVWHAEDMLALVGLEAALAGKMPMYQMVAATPSNGTLTVAPYTVATYTAGSSAEAFTVAVGTGTTGKARDCELVIDCTETEVAPTVTWLGTFHPRTDAGTDFACEAGVRNVYYISEYATGEFAVGGWQETAGGNA